MDYTIKRLWTKKNDEIHNEWIELLAKSNLKEEFNVDYTAGVYDKDRLIATGSYYENIIKCISVEDEYRGGSVLHQLISHLENEVRENGHTKFYIYTRPSKSDLFRRLGYKEIERVDDKLIFLEKAVVGFTDYIYELKKRRVEGERIGGIVMNANPFTLGHQYLIEYASKHCDVLHVFVVSEDRSVFPYQVRYELIKKGCAHLDNVYIYHTGNYMVSSQTFPSYFLNEDDVVISIQATLDARIFREHIAPALGIDVRFVGEEPYSKVTNMYNEAMSTTFEGFIELVIIPRIKSHDQVISATNVRAALASGDLERVKDMVPQTTYDFLISEDAKGIIEKLQKQHEERKEQKCKYVLKKKQLLELQNLQISKFL